MKADFEGVTYEVAVMDDNTGSIVVTLSVPFNTKAPHRVQLRNAKGEDASFQLFKQ